MKNLFLFTITLALIVSCTKKKEGIEVYNSFDVQINAEINGEKHAIPSNGSRIIKEGEGTFHLLAKIKDSTIMDTTFKVPDSSYVNGALINISGEEMYVVSERYGGTPLADNINGIIPIGHFSPEQVSDQNFLDSLANDHYEMLGILENNRKNAELVVLDSFLVFGNLRLIEGDNIFIPKSWDYGPTQEFPSEIEAESNASNNAFGLYRSKLFRKQDLLIYYLEFYL